MTSPNPSINRIKTDVMKLMSSRHEVSIVNNMNELIVKFEGPVDTPYAGGTWKVRVDLPERYPFKSPSIGFANRIYHPNIDETSGTVCLDVINQTWSPMYDLTNVFDAFLPQLLAYPNAQDPLNGDAAALFIHKPEEFNQKVKEYVKRYASGSAIEEISTSRFASSGSTPNRVSIPTTLGILLQGRNAHEFVRSVANAYLHAHGDRSGHEGDATSGDVAVDNTASISSSRHRRRRQDPNASDSVAQTAEVSDDENSRDTTSTSCTDVTFETADFEVRFGVDPPSMQIDLMSPEQQETSSRTYDCADCDNLTLDESTAMQDDFRSNTMCRDNVRPASPTEEPDPWRVNPEPWTVSPEPWTVNPEPSIDPCSFSSVGSINDDISLSSCLSIDNGSQTSRSRRWTFTSESDRRMLRDAPSSTAPVTANKHSRRMHAYFARERRRCITLPSNPAVSDESEMSDFDSR